MAVMTIRMNDAEEKMLKYISEHRHEDKSTVIKKSLREMYEDIQDIKFVDKYIKEDRIKKKVYITQDEMLKHLI